MALLIRNHASRRYAIASGVLFAVTAVAVAVIAVIGPRNGLSRLIGLALAAVLMTRGLFRIRQARTNRDQDQVGGADSQRSSGTGDG